MSEFGYMHEKHLPNGKLVAVTELTFSRGRIIIGDNYGVDNGW